MSNNLDLLMEDVISILMANVEDVDKRQLIYYDMINAFVSADAEHLDRCLNIDDSYDQAYQEVFGDWSDGEKE